MSSIANNQIATGSTKPTQRPVRQADVGRSLRLAFLAGASQYARHRAQLVTFGLFFILPPAILGSVWKAAAQSSGGSIVGYSAGALVWYIVVSETAILVLRQRLIADIGEDIGSGRLAVELQRPIGALPMRMASELGYMAPRLGVALALGALIGLVLGGRPPSLGSLTIAVPSLVLALILNLVGQYLFASSSFWLSESKGAWFIYNKLVFVLGGMLLPLEVLPGWMETVAKLLPFMAMAYAPARLASGHFEPWLLLIQLGWLGVIAAAANTMFKRGERHFMGAGGDQ